MISHGMNTVTILDAAVQIIQVRCAKLPILLLTLALISESGAMMYRQFQIQ
jgi:hypothetical protein